MAVACCFDRNVRGDTDVWLGDAGRLSRFTFEGGGNNYALWSPDGTRIASALDPEGSGELLSEAGEPRRRRRTAAGSARPKGLRDWSPDGRFLMYLAVAAVPSVHGLFVLPLEGERKPFPFVDTRFNEVWGQFSPDGRWVVYQSDESGRWEICVRPFPPERGGQWPVSTSGGVYPRWSPDGKEVYYIAPDSKLMATPVTVRGDALEVGTPLALFQTRIVGGGSNVVGRRQQYTVASDGRFLINETTGDAATSGRSPSS